jgi:excisionase family DNA binding protein
VKKLLQAYTVEQVAEMLHVGRDKVYYLLRTGQLRSIKIGKLRRITEQHPAAFIASREDVADASLIGTSRDVSGLQSEKRAHPTKGAGAYGYPRTEEAKT